jgi:2-amino-4-hydroxy-6-hydroxymethyldihydropteridine diphosphokinase
LIAVDNEIVPNPETYKKWQLLPIAQQTEIAPDRLILPHPRMQDRAFVLGPLMDIWPDWFHPVIQRSARQMFANLDVSDQSALSPL